MEFLEHLSYRHLLKKKYTDNDKHDQTKYAVTIVNVVMQLVRIVTSDTPL